MGIISFPTEVNTKMILKLTADVDNWSQSIFDNYLRSYESQEEIKRLWSRHMVFIGNFHNYFPNGITNNKFDSITCPVLILHGDKVTV